MNDETGNSKYFTMKNRLAAKIISTCLISKLCGFCLTFKGKKMRIKNLIVLFGSVIMITSCSSQRNVNKKLASEILADRSFEVIDSMARNQLKKGFNAGSGYSQVWARDLNTFVEIALDEVDHSEVRGCNTCLLYPSTAQ